MWLSFSSPSGFMVAISIQFVKRFFLISVPGRGKEEASMANGGSMEAGVLS